MTAHNLKCAIALAPYLGKPVNVPIDKIMRLVEIYSNGNVACIPIGCSDYDEQKQEFHADSVTPRIRRTK